MDTTSAKTWKYDYIHDKSQPNLLQCIGLNENFIEGGFEELFLNLEFDEDGTECKMEGIEGMF